MASIFNFQNLKNLVERNQILEIIILDTNVFIKQPDFETWKTSARSPVFLLSDRILEEILSVEEKKSKNRESSSQAAEKAHVALDSLLNKGDLSEGIYIKGVGWFVSYNLPSKQKLEPEIVELNALALTHGQNDAAFLVLTKHCSKEFRKLTVVLVTGDHGLNTCCKWHNLPVYYCRALPDKDFDNWLNDRNIAPAITDWDEVLTEINQDVKDNSIEVNLTLISKKSMHNWPCEFYDTENDNASFVEYIDIILAEGRGEVITPDRVVAFTWRLPYRPWTSENLSNDVIRGEFSPVDWNDCDSDGVARTVAMMSDADIDFLGRQDEVSPRIIQGIIKKLMSCEIPWESSTLDLPTLQSTMCLIESFLKIHSFLGLPEESVHPEGEDGVIVNRQPITFDDINKSISAWMATNPEEETCKFISFITRSWNIGLTVKTRVSLESGEPL